MEFIIWGAGGGREDYVTKTGLENLIQLKKTRHLITSRSKVGFKGLTGINQVPPLSWFVFWGDHYLPHQTPQLIIICGTLQLDK